MEVTEFLELEHEELRHPKKQLTIRLAHPVLAHLDLMALQNGRERNHLIRLAVYEYLKRKGIRNPHQI